MYEKQREGLMQTNFNMEQVSEHDTLCWHGGRWRALMLTCGMCWGCSQTNFAIQTVKDTQTTVEAMKTAAVTLREEQKKIDIDDIEVSSELSSSWGKDWGKDWPRRCPFCRLLDSSKCV